MAIKIKIKGSRSFIRALKDLKKAGKRANRAAKKLRKEIDGIESKEIIK